MQSSIRHEKLEQQKPGLDQVRTYSQQGVERATAAAQALERAGSEECRCVTEGEIQRAHVLSEKFGRTSCRVQAFAAARQAGGGTIDAVQREAGL